MSVNMNINVYIIAKTEQAAFDAKNRLLDTAFAGDSMRAWVDSLFTKPRFHVDHWHCEASAWLHIRAVGAIVKAFDGLHTDGYVVYGEVADSCDGLRCPETGLHHDVRWLHFNSDQVDAFLNAIYSHQPSQERG